jgi:hypothetical protein
MRSSFCALAFVVCLGFATGCVTEPKDDLETGAPAARSMGNAPLGSVSAEDEQWSKMGREMRGDPPPPTQQAWDPLRDLLESPRAQAIDRSLGVDN